MLTDLSPVVGDVFIIKDQETDYLQILFFILKDEEKNPIILKCNFCSEEIIYNL